MHCVDDTIVFVVAPGIVIAVFSNPVRRAEYGSCFFEGMAEKFVIK
jgi:hypothetical protein